MDLSGARVAAGDIAGIRLIGGLWKLLVCATEVSFFCFEIGEENCW